MEKLINQFLGCLLQISILDIKTVSENMFEEEFLDDILRYGAIRTKHGMTLCL